jgi:hypothetical protein
LSRSARIDFCVGLRGAVEKAIGIGGFFGWITGVVRRAAASTGNLFFASWISARNRLAGYAGVLPETSRVAANARVQVADQETCTSGIGPGPPTSLLQQMDSHLGYTGRAANVGQPLTLVGLPGASSNGRLNVACLLQVPQEAPIVARPQRPWCSAPRARRGIVDKWSINVLLGSVLVLASAPEMSGKITALHILWVGVAATAYPTASSWAQWRSLTPCRRSSA